MALYARFQAAFAEGLALTGADARLFTIPHSGKTIFAIFVPAKGGTDPQPILVLVKGLGQHERDEIIRWSAQMAGQSRDCFADR